MNYSTAVVIMNDDIRMIETMYETQGKRVLFKTLDKDIKEDDLVVVPTDTRHKFTVVKVTAVDVLFDPDDTTQVGWIASRVDLEQHKITIEEEKQLIETLRASEVEKKRKDIRANVMEYAQGSGIEKIAIANMSEEKKAG